MGRVLLGLPALAILMLIAFTGRASGERLTARVPGDVVLRGDPDGIGAYRIVPAFPSLAFRRPLWVGEAPDSSHRMFVLEQDGRVLWFEQRTGAREAHVALDLSEKVYRRHNEEGLLGLAFHPQYAENRRLFLHYSASGPRRGVIARFEATRDGTRIRPESEQVILEQPQPWGNHNGGGLAFGPDGYLYISFGDGGAGGDPLNSGQDLSTWLGSMLRIDVDHAAPYSVPPDNPFVGREGARPEIWAYGLRNVWRFSFDRLTGTCWGGDVGQDAWEEITHVERGGNHGWRLREGDHPYRGGEKLPGMVEPIISHDHGEARSITGGYVYRGTKLPGLVGSYVYADYATGWLWALRHDGSKVTNLVKLGRAGAVSSFGEDAAGELYWTAFDGRIYTLEPGTEVGAAPFPRTLSETGLFSGFELRTPHPALVPYGVNAPLWSDGAEKDRYVMLPGTAKVQVKPDGTYAFPPGTIFVKTFRAGTRRLETRLLVLRDGSWGGYTYVWDPFEAEAHLIDGRVERTLRGDLARQLGTQRWTFPGRADCSSCHTPQAGFVLGFRSEQLDRVQAYGETSENQLDAFARIGLFEGTPRTRPAWPDWTDDAGPLEGRVRAYLDANCAFCHRPEGTGNARIDLRYETPLERTGLLRGAPGQGDLGVGQATLLTPRAASLSLLWLRMARTDARGMPNIAHNSVDKRGLALVRQWIEEMPAVR